MCFTISKCWRKRNLNNGLSIKSSESTKWNSIICKKLKAWTTAPDWLSLCTKEKYNSFWFTLTWWNSSNLILSIAIFNLLKDKIWSSCLKPRLSNRNAIKLSPFTNQSIPFNLSEKLILWLVRLTFLITICSFLMTFPCFL